VADRGQGWWPERPPRRDRSSRSDRPPRGLASRRRAGRLSRYSLFVGIAFAALVVVAVVNAIRTDNTGLLGADPDATRGSALPEFAAPDALRPELADLDANVAQDDCAGPGNPCPADDVRVPACEVEVPGSIRVCDLFDRPLAISFWFTKGGNCLPTQDAFDEVASTHAAEANFLSVNVLDDRDRVEEIVRGSGWQVPVAHDTDGAISNLYGVGVCPTILLAYPGGIVHEAEIKPGNFTREEIETMLDDLLAASAEREGRA
jgi:hypothetical protein